MTGEDPRRRGALGRGLGRGLSALFGDDGDAGAVPADSQRRLPIEFLQPGRFQPRRRFDEGALAALAESIRERGVLLPLLVRAVAPDRFEIVAGERRWRAAQLAGLHEVPVVVRDLDDREALEIAIVENVQRQDLTPLEEAEGYRRLIDEFGHTQEALAQVVGKSRSHIANTLRLLALPDPVKALVTEGEITAGHARALLALPDPVAAAKEVVRRGLNVRQTEMLGRAGGATPTPPAERGAGSERGGGSVDAELASLEAELTRALGLKVSIARTHHDRGALTIHYTSLDQLDAVLARLR